MGVSLAYALADRGRTRVTLLERDLLAQASTGLCVGGIRQQFSLPSNIRLSQQTLRLFKRFKDLFGTDIQFHQVGYLFLIEEGKTWEEFRLGKAVQEKLGVPVEELTPEEIRYRWPYISTEGLRGGFFCGEDGYADPHLVTMGLAQYARERGITILEKTEATDILQKGGSITGVKTTRGTIHTPLVVNAAGPWAAEIGRMVGLDLPVKPFRRQVFMTKDFPAIPKPIPMVLDQDAGFYFRGEGGGLLTGMSDPDEPSSYNTHTDRAFLERVIDSAVRRAPILESAEILRGWGGLYSISPDENAIIGSFPHLDGFFCAIGFSGHGFQHGPAVGEILAELLSEGRTGFDLDPYAFGRFKEGEVTKESATL